MKPARWWLGATVFGLSVLGGAYGASELRRWKAGPEPAVSARPHRRTLLASSRLGVGVLPKRDSGPPPSGQGVLTDGREKTQGAAYHPDALARCKEDKTCLFSKCGELCNAWIPTAYQPGDFRGPQHSQQVYVNCVGFCLDPTPDAGR